MNKIRIGDKFKMGSATLVVTSVDYESDKISYKMDGKNFISNIPTFTYKVQTGVIMPFEQLGKSDQKIVVTKSQLRRLVQKNTKVYKGGSYLGVFKQAFKEFNRVLSDQELINDKTKKSVKIIREEVYNIINEIENSPV